MNETFTSAPQSGTQLQQVRKHILEKGSITSWEAIMKYGITRISQYILLLREEGLDIDTVWKTVNKKRFGVYTLKNETL